MASDYFEIGRLISNMIDKTEEAGLTVWLVEEETGESVKVRDFINSEKRSESGVFKRIM